MVVFAPIGNRMALSAFTGFTRSLDPETCVSGRALRYEPTMAHLPVWQETRSSYLIISGDPLLETGLT